MTTDVRVPDIDDVVVEPDAEPSKAERKAAEAERKAVDRALKAEAKAREEAAKGRERAAKAAIEADRAARRVRMSGSERREQLIDVGLHLFAEKGYEAVSVEEIAAVAKVSKPVVYEHFGGKEGLYAVIIDREVHGLLATVVANLGHGDARIMTERAVLSFLTYVDENPDGFRVLLRDAPVNQGPNAYSGMVRDIVVKTADVLVPRLEQAHVNKKFAQVYARGIVGTVAFVAQSWVDDRKPGKDELAAHVVNLIWNGLGGLAAQPALDTEVLQK
jgi:AcrR family transcriptional regulator